MYILNQGHKIKLITSLKIILLLITDNQDTRFYIRKTYPCKGVLRIFSYAYVESHNKDYTIHLHVESQLNHGNEQKYKRSLKNKR